MYESAEQFLARWERSSPQTIDAWNEVADALSPLGDGEHRVADAARYRVLRDRLVGEFQNNRPPRLPPLDLQDALTRNGLHLEALVGMGGYGWVFSETRGGDRAVAVKVQPIDLRFEEEAYRRECDLLARVRPGGLAHSSLLDLLDAGESDPGDHRRYGWTVQHLLRDPRPVHEAIKALGNCGRPALNLLNEAIGGLATLHAAGYHHGDLKPDNILVSDGHTYLMDLGQSDRLNRRLFGTEPYYSSNDFADYAKRADVRAMGVVLYLALEQRFPNDVAPLRFSRLASGTEAFQGIIRAALGGDPDSDLRDAVALAERFETALRYLRS